MKFNLSFQNKILALIVLTGVAAAGVGLYVASGKIMEVGEKGLKEEAQTVLTQIENASAFVSRQGYLEQQVKDVVRRTPSGQISQEDKFKILHSVPVFAALKLGEEVGKSNKHLKFRVFDPEPRNPDNKATDEEMAFYRRFESDSNLKEIVEHSPDGNEVWVMRPVRLTAEAGCLACHGDSATSPWGNGKDVLGYPMENMKHGDLNGVFMIKADLHDVQAASANSVWSILLWTGGALALVLALAITLIKASMNRLTRISNNMSTTEGELTQNSVHLDQISQSLSSSTQEQAAAIQETASAVEEMRAMAQRNSESSRRTSEVAQQAQDAVRQGQTTLNSLIQSINGIESSNNELRDRISQNLTQLKGITDLIGEISNKTNIINDIVFQTKLLSFNASVEAARAGEAGKGFSVVAEEVGNLAKLSGDAAREINAMLERSVSRVSELVDQSTQSVNSLVDSSKGKITDGVRQASQTERSFGDIVQQIQHMTEMANQIMSASEEQARGIAEISKAIGQLDEASHQNAESSLKAADSARQLNTQATSLREAVAQLVTVMTGVETSLESVSADDRPDQKPRINFQPFKEDFGGTHADDDGSQREPIKKIHRIQ
jgi:methyl-accepting chemotaxis protein